MNVLLVTEFYYPHVGGITEHVHHLARWLAAHGHHVTVLTSHVADAPRRPDREAVEGFEVVRIGEGIPIDSNGSQARITVGSNLDQLVAHEVVRADLVHVHSPLFPMLPYLALKAARRHGVATVGTFHTNFTESRAWSTFASLIRGYARALDRCIAVSESAARSVRAHVDQPFTIIPNGIDLAGWAAGVPRHELRATKNILFLGRLDPRNDVDLLVEAFRPIASAEPDARLVFVGDGPRRAGYQALVGEALRGRVWFAGAHAALEARADFLASAAAIAFTARVCSHPQTLIEAMAAGRPVVAYDIEGVRELVTPGVEGWLAAPGAVDSLARGLANALALDANTANTMGLAARARVADFDWSVVARRIETTYRDVLAGRAAS